MAKSDEENKLKDFATVPSAIKKITADAANQHTGKKKKFTNLRFYMNLRLQWIKKF